MPSLDALHWAFRRIQADEAWKTHRDFLSATTLPIRIRRLRSTSHGEPLLDAEQLSADRRLRHSFRAQLGDLLGDDGVVILPTMPDVAPLLSAGGPELESYRYRVQLLCLAGLAGFPQVTLPAGRVSGAPLVCLLMGPAGSDLGLVELVLGEGLINLL